jgi:RimJ/RimL family protein N-acetyltransferase
MRHHLHLATGVCLGQRLARRKISDAGTVTSWDARRVRDSLFGSAGDSRFTMRLRLEPIGPANAHDLWRVHGDDDVWPWYGDEKPSLEQAEQRAKFMGDSWRSHGVHKWIAYDRVSGEVVGRGGLSRTPVDDDWGQIYRFLPAESWVRAVHEVRRPFSAHADWLEIGWALRRKFWGHGYASEIGRAGLAFAFDVLGVRAVVSCAVRHNVRSRAVMERLGMRYAGEIRSRGMIEGVEGERDDAPYAVCVLLRRDYVAGCLQFPGCGYGCGRAEAVGAGEIPADVPEDCRQEASPSPAAT